LTHCQVEVKLTQEEHCRQARAAIDAAFAEVLLKDPNFDRAQENFETRFARMELIPGGFYRLRQIDDHPVSVGNERRPFYQFDFFNEHFGELVRVVVGYLHVFAPILGFGPLPKSECVSSKCSARFRQPREGQQPLPISARQCLQNAADDHDRVSGEIARVR
jgi:hypothetical protein